ncbi:tRNA wybutosine-synthesis [Dillenia turbinata]|uniref:tRNA wybutosine-synthesis n=1 Tax=Dillenia turbinata TaxID=194707 RepID=A0AAN8ZFC7_9MAGN
MSDSSPIGFRRAPTISVLRALGVHEVLSAGEGDVDGGDFVERRAGKCNGVNGFGGDNESWIDGYDEEDYDYDDDEENGTNLVIVDLEDIGGKGPSRKSVNGAVASNGEREKNGEKEMSLDTKFLGHIVIVALDFVDRPSYNFEAVEVVTSNLFMASGVIDRCMEATPSLARANKCVFCWRHHTNPVGKSWRWKIDDPLEIVELAIDLHTKMIKQMKGVPEGLSTRHCTLSLVGKPIMYPEINALVNELHRRRISTFLVTNAQFPEKIKMLKPVTQDSLKALQEKQQRTDYRLTLVKGWNIEDINAYCNLFNIGNPDFIEIKGVTYCGSSATSKLTMENVPWHSDVKAFSEALSAKSNGEYEVAFLSIMYENRKMQVASGKPFNSQDYMAATSSWAVYGAEEGGFDPDQARYRKERHHKSSRS